MSDCAHTRMLNPMTQKIMLVIHAPSISGPRFDVEWSLSKASTSPAVLEVAILVQAIEGREGDTESDDSLESCQSNCEPAFRNELNKYYHLRDETEAKRFRQTWGPNLDAGLMRSDSRMARS